MTKEEFTNWAEWRGYKNDGTDRYVKETSSFVVKENEAVLERFMEGRGWLKVQSGLYENLTVSEDGRLEGLRR